MRIRNQSVEVSNPELKNGGVWKWSINYSKFRGRGSRATENILGADGIFELTLQMGNVTETKSILFQTKKDWNYDHNVLDQALKLTNWREAAFVLNFTQDRYEAFKLDNVINSRGRKSDNSGSTTLADFLGGDFLDCIVGDVHLKYDSRLRKLSWLTMQHEFVSTYFSIPDKIRLKIVAPNPNGDIRIISNDEVFSHRMEASAEEILSLNYGFSEQDLRKARADKAKTFHLDAANIDDDFLNSINNLRMQEINHAHDKLKSKFKT